MAKTKKINGAAAFSVADARLWNDISLSIRSKDNLPDTTHTHVDIDANSAELASDGFTPMMIFGHNNTFCPTCTHNMYLLLQYYQQFLQIILD